MNVRLECRDLVVSYGDVVAVDHIDLSVGEGEVFGLLGPNGAGKTSVIRALTTILEPTGGTATVAGADLSDHGAVRRRIGVLPESTGYPNAQTGHAYLQFYGQLFGLSRAEAGDRATRLLEQLGLGSTRQRIAEYSRGMRQRLGLCRALINDPEVLFLDEPTLGLDPAGKEDVVRHLAEIAVTKGTTIVLCTHLLDEVERVCDHVAIMASGHLVAGGSVDDVIAAAAIGGLVRLRVRPGEISAVCDLVADVDGVDGIEFDNARPGDLDIRLRSNGSASAASLVLGAVLRGGVEVRAFDNQQASLNDAFLALTAGGDR